MADKNEQHSYGKEMLVAAPIFGAKAVLGDIPRAAVEGATENKAMGSSKSFGHLLRQAAGGRGLGRALGGGMGIVTAPLYLRGVRLLGSKDKDDQRKGLGMIGAGTAVYAGGKGFLEKAIEAHATGASLPVAASKGALLAATRSAYKIPLALAMAAGVAAGRNKSDKDPAAKYLVPLAVGAGAGALSRGIESSVESAANKGMRKNLRQVTKRTGAAMAGGAVGGLLGALVLAKVTDVAEGMLRPKKKQASVGGALSALAGAAGHVLHPANLVPHAAVGYATTAIPLHLATSAMFGHGLGHRALQGLGAPGQSVSRWFQRSGNEARARQVAIGIKEGIQGKAQQTFRSAVVLNHTVPELLVQREMGLKLGRALREYHPDDRGKILYGLQNVMVRNPRILRGTEGEANPMLSPIFGGVAMALGDRKMYAQAKSLPTFHKAYEKLMHGGTGVLEPGLPAAGRLRAEPKSFLGKTWQHWGTLPISLAGMGAGMSSPAAHVGAHGVVSGAKSIIANVPAVARSYGTYSTNKAVRRGLLPGLAKQDSRLARDLLETLGSPAASHVERSLQPVVTAIRDGVLDRGAQKGRNALRGAADRLLAPRKSDLASAALVPMAATAGGGALLGNALYPRRSTERK